jgi:DNA-binding protein
MTKKEGKKEKPPAKKNKKQYKRRFRVNKKLEGNTGTIFIGSEDPFMYFPDMMSYLEREEITEVKLKARGKSISNAVNIAEQFKNRFKELQTEVKDVKIGTENVPKKDNKGTFRMSFIEITIISNKNDNDE